MAVQTKVTTFAQYQELVLQSSHYLATRPQPDTALKLSSQLSAIRLTLPENSAALLQSENTLPAALQQIEIILLLCRHYHWPHKIQQLALNAGFCSVLCQAMPQQEQNARLQRYPALLAAQALKQAVQHKQLSEQVGAILAGCYPAERKLTDCLQNPLSLILTQAEYLSSQSMSVLQQIGLRIVLTQSEYEIALLRQLLLNLTGTDYQQPSEHSFADFFTNSRFSQLHDAETQQLEQYLQLQPELTAPVLARASQLNRQRQKITNLHLALNLLGRQQLPFILAEAELNYQLTRLKNPSQPLWQQFSTLMAHALKLLCNEQQSTAYWQTLSLCLCAPLWCSNNGYTKALLLKQRQGYAGNFDDNIYRQNTTHALVSDLLRHYQLTAWQLPVADWLHGIAPANSKSATIALAWNSCKVLLLNSSPEPLKQQPLPPAIQNTQDWLTLLATSSECYCPLTLSL